MDAATVCAPVGPDEGVGEESLGTWVLGTADGEVMGVVETPLVAAEADGSSLEAGEVVSTDGPVGGGVLGPTDVTAAAAACFKCSE